MKHASDQRLFIEECAQSEAWTTLHASLRSLLGRPIWWLVEQADLKMFAPQKATAAKRCQYLSASKTQERRCQTALVESARQVATSSESVQFVCPAQFPAVCQPIRRGDELAGFVTTCHISSELDQATVDVLEGAVQLAARAVETAKQLAALRETTKPRAMALSTIHTVHRLISSTLNLDELLPRVARLCLQVLRARSCRIYLCENDGPYLQPAAAVQLGGQSKSRRHRIGQGVVGRVADSGQAILEPNVLCVPLIDEDLIGVIVVRDRQHHQPFTSFDQEILGTLAEQAVIAIHNARLYEEQEHLTLGGIKALAAVLDVHSPETYTHTSHFPDLVMTIGEALGLSHKEIRNLHYAALLPDTGKIAVPDEILTKPTSLTDPEYDVVKASRIKGAEILAPLRALESVVPIILHQHEHYDGSGYPNGLPGSAIPIGSRVLAVAHAFETMLRSRPYREQMTVEQAVVEIQSHSGTQFDPVVVEAFLDVVQNGGAQPFLKELEHVALQ